MSIALEEKIRTLEAKVAEQDKQITQLWDVLLKLQETRKPGRPKNV